MASKKKAVVVAKKNGAGKDAACEDGSASKQTRGVKAKKTEASGNGAGEGEAKRGTTLGTKREVKRKPKREAEKHPKVRAAGGARKNLGSEQELDPFEVAKRKVKGSVPAIVEAMVELAKQGSCTHAKTLLEMTGARHMFDGDAEAQGGESWAKLVLERLDEADCEAERESVQEESQEVAVAE